MATMRLFFLVYSLFVTVCGSFLPSNPQPLTSRLLHRAVQFCRSISITETDAPHESDKYSVHLRLKDVPSVVSEHEKQGVGRFIIHKCKLKLNNETVLASFGGRRSLEHFRQHMMNRNLSSDDELYYTEDELDVTNEVAVRELEQLWRAGRYLAQAKDYRDDWRTDKTGPAVTLQRFRRRLQFLNSTAVTIRDMEEFLNHHGNDMAGRCRHLLDDSNDQVLKKLQAFAGWFKNEFPYYYDACLSGDCGNSEGNEYLGTVFPSEEERDRTHAAAGRTELYLCGRCRVVTRFPRYNAVRKVLSTRRGRCGEYSPLALHLLRAVGYVARWVADRDDHVWVEVRVGARWVHLDPCDAVVDQSLLYQAWGKNQTYILAYSEEAVEDVTLHYTDDGDAVRARRLAEGIDEEQMSRLLWHEQAHLRSSVPAV